MIPKLERTMLLSGKSPIITLFLKSSDQLTIAGFRTGVIPPGFLNLELPRDSYTGSQHIKLDVSYPFNTL